MLTVDVQAWPLGYRWTFGDGRTDGRAPGPAVVTGSLGRAAVPRDPRQPLQAGRRYQIAVTVPGQEAAHVTEFSAGSAIAITISIRRSRYFWRM